MVVRKQHLVAGIETEDEQSLTSSSMSVLATVLTDAVSSAVPEVKAIAIRHVTEVLLKR